MYHTCSEHFTCFTHVILTVTGYHPHFIDEEIELQS